jgi:hypothetical protein
VISSLEAVAGFGWLASFLVGINLSLLKDSWKLLFFLATVPPSQAGYY